MFLFGGSRNSQVGVGIDIGTTAIKVAELTSGGKNSLELTNYALLEIAGHLDHFNNALQSSSLRPLDTDLVAYLRLIQEKVGLKTNHVRASIPSFSSFTTLIEVPLASSAETNKVLEFQVKNYIPLPITEVTLDWIKVGEKTYPDGSKKQQIFLVSTPNEKIESYTKIFSQAGFILDGIELENIAAARMVTNSTEAATLIIDIGGRSTSFTVAERGVVKFTGQTDFSSNSLTQALATALNISPRRADALKRETMIVGGLGSHELSTILIPIIDVIISEATRVRTGFEQAFGTPITNSILIGSGAHMPGFEAYLTQHMNMPVVEVSELRNVVLRPEILAIGKELASTLTVSAGLALKTVIH